MVERLITFAVDVTSVVPSGFARYARVFHPHDGRRWAEVAAANGRVVHREMQWHAIGGDPNDAPYDGTVPVELQAPLVATLRAHTTTPDRCWFAVWEGFGGIAPEVHAAPSLEIPGRRLHLFTGPIEAVGESFCEPPWRQSANLWWPDDRAWCVATEIDFCWTYVGGSADCIDAVLARPELEALEAKPSDGITIDADTVNR
ncbi:MAG TPA: hypothetical protein VM938_12925 [Acidimicrobiales bacterium]|nr:hypothetical protein [Acidimicrobiales bacterium]